MGADMLVYEAKSFYNAFIALERIHYSCENPTHYYMPTIVNGAFSIELTLKAILAKNQIEYGKEHNLVILFQLLPESFQLELLNHLVEKAPEYKDTKKCTEEFLLISNAFADWRYAFEKAAPSFDMRFLSAFANAAIWTMFSHYNVSYEKSTEPKVTIDELDEMIHKNREECKNANILAIQKKMKRQRMETRGENT